MVSSYRCNMSKTGANIQKDQNNHIALIIPKSDLANFRISYSQKTCPTNKKFRTSRVEESAVCLGESIRFFRFVEDVLAVDGRTGGLLSSFCKKISVKLQ